MKRLLFVFLGTVVLLHSQIQPKIVVSSDKSPKKAMAMSAIIPGAGQLYANKYVASAVYVGLEIALIASSVISGNKGRSLVTDYEKYADDHWNIQRWFEGGEGNVGYYDNLAGNPQTHNVYIIVDERRYSFEEFTNKFQSVENLPENYEIVEEYHFYENIGKYKQFKQGWDDYTDNSDFETDRRSSLNQDEYSVMRLDANDYLKNATYLGTAVMFNHLISAIDAFVRVNKSLDSRLEANVYPLLDNKNSGAMINLSIKL